MLEHVLVPLDQSGLAETALDTLPILVASGSRVTLLTVLVPPELSLSALYGPTEGMTQMAMEAAPGYEGLERQIRVQAEDYLRKVGERVQATGAEVDIMVRVGRDAEVIVDQARALGVDAVLMATHGRSGLSRWLLGSVTQKVLSAATCPVIVIPNADAQKKD